MMRRTLRLANATAAAERFAAKPDKFGAPSFFRLDDVSNVRAWNFSAPTLTKRARFTARQKWAAGNKELQDHFDTKFPALRSILEASGDDKIALKGGCFSSLLLGSAPSDLDFYVVGTDCLQESQRIASRVLEAVVNITMLRADADAQRHLSGEAKTRERHGGEAWSQERIDAFVRSKVNDAVSRLFGTRRGSVITVSGIHGIDVPIQITLSPYAKLEQLMEDGDVDSGAVVMTRSRGIELAPRAKFALENWAIHADWNDEALSAKRLISYFNRGFDIVLPGLDLSKVHKRNKRLAVPTSFELCDGELLVEVDGDMLNNRIPVANLILREKRGSSGSGGGGGGEGSKSDTPAHNEPDHPSDVTFVKRGGKNNNPRRQAIRAIEHNVQEILYGGRNFHTVSYGKEIVQLADVRAMRVTQRQMESTLGQAAKTIEKDPFGAAALKAMLCWFPGTQTSEGLTEIIPPKGTQTTFADYTKERSELLLQKQLGETAAVLKECQEELGAVPLGELISPPVSNAIPLKDFYGAFGKKQQPAV